MLVRLYNRNPSLVLRVGLGAFLVATILRYLVQSRHAISGQLGDPLMGFAYGVGIATMLLVVHLRSRSPQAGSRCAS